MRTVEPAHGPRICVRLIADARAAGVTEITALVSTDNRAAVSLLLRIVDVVDVRREGRELSIRATIR